MRAGIIVAAAVLLGGCSAQQEPSSGGPLDAYYQQEVAWSGCGDGYECAKIKVPLDYEKPDEKIEISAVRLRATGSDRIGSIVLNPGGPGGSGIRYARAARNVLSPAVLERFDVVGFDPRGVGESTPVRCLPPERLDAFAALDGTPDSSSERKDLVDGAKEFADGCEGKAARLLPHVGTADAARDMDVLRAALGDDGLTYLGKSYGTYLGAHYAQLFPSRVRALVLDGAVDPDLKTKQVNETQARGFEVALDAFLKDCVAQRSCPLGATVDEADRTVKDLLKRADKSPLKNDQDDGRQVNEAWATTGMASALYDRGSWKMLRQALKEAMDGDGTLLIKLADYLVDRKADGTYSNQTESNMAINCLDRAAPPDHTAFQSAARAADKKAPRFGEAIMWSSLPCAYWPVRPASYPPLKATGAKPILVVGTTRDPATPVEWAEALAGQLDSGVLLRYDGDGHTAYRLGSTCVDDAVDQYLIDGKAPRDGTECM